MGKEDEKGQVQDHHSGLALGNITIAFRLGVALFFICLMD